MKTTPPRSYSLLALGDSYTIGEAVPLHKNFPYQAIQLLRKKGLDFLAPEIIAKTGWTSEELKASIKNYKFLERYDFVTLLIGVNNQYRGVDIIEYKEEFEYLLKKAISLAHGKTSHVFVISIPDYSITPFAKDKNVRKISKEVDEYNTLSKAISIQYKVNFIDITRESRKAKTNSTLLAHDGLHPSPKEYSKWAKKLAEGILKLVKK